MSGYLAGYGAGGDRKANLIKNAVISIGSVVVAAILLYFGLRNYAGRSAMDSFIELLQKKDYQSAYRLWGCTEQTPCPNYTFDRFMRDWGPDSPAKNVASAKIEQKATCGGILANTGLLRVYHFEPDYTVNLWYEKTTGTLGFAPLIGKLQCTVLP